MSDRFEDPGRAPDDVPERDAALAPLLGELPQAVEPARDLWPAIRSALQTSGRRAPSPRAHSRVRSALLAAAAVIVVLGGVRIFLAERPTTPERRTAFLPGDGYGLTLWRAMEAEGRGAREEFRAAVQAPETRLRPYVIEVLEGNLEILDQAIGETARALAAHPRDRRLLERLAEHHRRRMALVHEALHT